MVMLLGACSAQRAPLDPATSAEERAADAPGAPPFGFAAPNSANAPLANAGPDLEVARGATVFLDGRRSFHAFGEDFVYLWSQVGDTAAVALSNPAKPFTSFTAPANLGALRFKLTVTASNGLSTSDEVTVNVVHTLAQSAPALVLTPDVVVGPGASVTLTATGIGNVLDADVKWRIVAGTSVPFSETGAHKDVVQLSAPESGITVLRAETTDFGLSSAPDDVVVRVDSAGPTQSSEAPLGMIAATGRLPLTSSVLPRPATDTGTLYTQLAGDFVAFSDADAFTFVTPAIPQRLWFGRTLDPTQSTSFDALVYVDVAVPDFVALVPDAGPDLLAHPGNTIRLDGTRSSSNEGLKWVKKLGPATTTLTGDTTTRPSFVAPEAPAQLVFALTITRNGGVTHEDAMVVTVLPLADNRAPTGAITPMYAGGDNYTLLDTFTDPEFDAFTCEWSSNVTLADPGPPTLVLDEPSEDVTATCCDHIDCTTFAVTVP